MWHARYRARVSPTARSQKSRTLSADIEISMPLLQRVSARLEEFVHSPKVADVGIDRRQNPQVAPRTTVEKRQPLDRARMPTLCCLDSSQRGEVEPNQARSWRQQPVKTTDPTSPLGSHRPAKRHGDERALWPRHAGCESSPKNKSPIYRGALGRFELNL